VDRLTAIDQSIFMETQLSALFNHFSMACYDRPEISRFWAKMAMSEAAHLTMIEYEKWRVAREELDTGRIKFDDPALLRQMKKFDRLRDEVVVPAEPKKTFELGLRAEEDALEFHENRIFIAEFELAENVLQALVEDEDFHHDLLMKLSELDDPEAHLKACDLSPLDRFFI